MGAIRADVPGTAPRATAEKGGLSEDQQALVLAHQELVEAIAKRVKHILPRWLDLGDLVGTGQLGLLEAARKFDPGRGTAFSAYARSRIRGSIIDAHRRKNYDFELHEELGENSTETAAGNPLNHRLFEQFRDVIGTLLRALPDNESYTIAATLRGETLQEIGEHLGVTESAACLTRQAACTKLGVLLRAGGYRQSDLLPD